MAKRCTGKRVHKDTMFDATTTYCKNEARIKERIMAFLELLEQPDEIPGVVSNNPVIALRNHLCVSKFEPPISC